MRKSSIAPSAIQTLFDSAANAASKGQAQWFTPVEWARTLSLPLNDYRPVIADLTCGNGRLFAGAKSIVRRDDVTQLGCDLETPSPMPHPLAANFVSADITRFYPLLCAVDWKCDAFVLNPPWDLHWYREPLSRLADSECPAVREAFAAHDGRTSRDTIDSTIATLCIALDRSSTVGEGFLIGNEATLQRLLFAKGAPHAALVQHIWAHIAIEGNICCNKAGPSGTDFQTGVIWFARGHSRGPTLNRAFANSNLRPDDKDLPGLVRRVCTQLKSDRLLQRDGPEAASYLRTQNCQELWQAAKEEHEREQGFSKLPPYNIWLDHDAPGGTPAIRTHLNLFDSVRVDKTAAAALHALNGRQPIQLVVQRSQRQALLDAVKCGSPWRVDPALELAVAAAITEYNRVRAPLYPLPKIQRLGYLDEQDDILCCKSFGNPAGAGGQCGTHFVAGQRYFLRSTTVATRRSGTKVNNLGLLDDVEWNGQELAFFITDQSGTERCFMEGRLREENVKINLIRPGSKGRKDRDLEDECAIDFTLQQLVEHFVIPEVPDVATRLPEQYAAHRQTMLDIVKFLGGNCPAEGFRFKQFQVDDYARAALHDGIILGHDTGLGKTIAMFIWPLLKCGLTASGPPYRLRPTKPVLLVVPGDGHDQTDDESLRHFKTKSVRLDSQATFLKLAKPDPRTGRFTLEPNYYLTSYTQLTGNGVANFPPLDRANPERTLSQLNLNEADAVEWWNHRGRIYQKHYERLKVTPDSTWQEIENAFKSVRHASDKVVTELAQESLEVLKLLTPLPDAKPAGRRTNEEARMQNDETKRFNAAAQTSSLLLAPCSCSWELLSAEQQQFVRSELAITRHREFSQAIGESRTLPAKDGQPEVRVKCVYSPSLADLCADSFAACVIDEGTKIKGDETIVGTGVRSINAPFRLVLTATPIKNRFPDVFHLAHYVTGGHDEPTARFPYGKVDKQDFAEEFLVSERNLTKEENSEEKRRFIKFTPQVCNVHRAWKLLAPIILRRRKDDCGEDIVPKIRHVVRVPMGLGQAAAYQFHLKARYLDINGRPAVGAKLQALRIAAANPASDLLIRPEHDVTPGNPRSLDTYIPKVASTLELIRQVMERGEQVLVFSAFQNGLDVFSARLNEAGVKHLVLDGRLPQKRRGELAKLFKRGNPRAVAEGLFPSSNFHSQSSFPVALCGAECMAELHSFHLCNNVILTAYSWAFDKFEQGINRAHRLNSPWPVNVWSVVCEGSIDRKLEAGIHEKKDAAELVLDGHLLGESPQEVNLHELLCIAQTEFKKVKTIDEDELKQGWPRLRAALGMAFLDWRNVRANEKNQPNEPSNIQSQIPLWKQRFSRHL